MSADYMHVHDDAIVVDAVSPLLTDPKYLNIYKQGGFNCVAPTVGGGEGIAETVRFLGEYQKWIDSRDDVILARTAKHIEDAKAAGKFSIVYHFQGTEPFENKLETVEAYRELGVRMVQLTYNVRNRVGDGCIEPSDAGLSQFGLALIERLNANRIVVDCAHTGYRTTMEAMEASTRPVVFSHNNAKAVYDTVRSITDDQAKAVAKTGGMIGVNVVPYFIKPIERPTMDEFIAHIDHFVRLLGPDHVGLGFDYYRGQQPFCSDEEAVGIWQRHVDTGRWDPKFWPKPTQLYPEGLDTPAELRNLTKALLAKRYSAEDVKKILGGNWVRVFRAVWGE